MASLCRRGDSPLEALSAVGVQCRVVRRSAAKESPMQDLLFLGLGLVGFVALAAYARFCNRN